MPPVNNEPDANPEPQLAGQPAGAPTKRHSTLKHLILWSLGTVCLVTALAIGFMALAFSSISPILSKCGSASALADQAIPQLQAKLDTLNIGNDASVKATSLKYGDCIDSNAYVAEANVIYDYSYTVDPSLLSFNQTITDQLKTHGYTPKNSLELQPIGENGDLTAVFAFEAFVASGQPDLNVTYTIKPPYPFNCDSNQPADTYKQCLATYKASFAHLDLLTVVSVTAKMAKSFPHE